VQAIHWNFRDGFCGSHVVEDRVHVWVSSLIVCVLANYFRIIDFENFVIYGYTKEQVEVSSFSF